MKLKSDSQTAVELPWDADAEQALGKAPFFVRKLVRRKVAERVSERGGDRVTMADFREAEARYKAVSSGKTEEEMKQMMPTENETGVEMVSLNACHSKLSGCPNPVIDTDKWKAAVEKWIEERDLHEKLRAKVTGKKVFFHSKLKISISGCPNGCSRYQIADIGIVGTAKPSVDPAECTHCAACQDACPDGAITVNGSHPAFDMSLCQGCKVCGEICPFGCIDTAPQGVKIFLGGKLGRRPHLAEFHSNAKTPEEMIRILDEVVDGYIRDGKRNERFTEYWMRTAKGGADNER